MIRECVVIDGVRTANARAHKEKGWFRNWRPDELLAETYKALFARNPKVDPVDVESVFIGCSAQINEQNDIGRWSWLIADLPERVASNTICQQCPSGMAAVEHAARAIIAGEGDVYVAGGVDDMLKVPAGTAMNLSSKIKEKYTEQALTMGATAEKVAEMYDIKTEDMEQMAVYSHKRAAAARDSGKFDHEIVPIEGHDENGVPFVVAKDQWIRDDLKVEDMQGMKTPFKEGGKITAAFSSPLTTGACSLILMSRSKADELGLEYHVKYAGGVMEGCDPTTMGLGPIFAVRKLLSRVGIGVGDVDVVEINEAFASQSLACLRTLGIEQNAPFEKTNVWGGALALGHPLGSSGARLVITLNNIMKYEKPNARFGLATLCGGYGNANASLWESVEF